MSDLDSPAIFYSPHQDDESIGMAGAIREHKEAGRSVHLVLLTNGINQGLLDIMNGANGPCPLAANCRQPDHALGLSMDDMIGGRTAEFYAAAEQLGVDEVHTIGLNDDDVVTDRAGFIERIKEVILDFEGQFPGASHKLVSGWRDQVPSEPNPNPTHSACRDAAEALRDQIADFRFHWTYAYFREQSARTADFVLDLTDSQFAAKRQAILEYNRWEPDNGRYALGYHSVSTLLENAYSDPREYIDVLH
ncbi:PIG-L family deacetylase [Streptomyces sp. NBC_00133]|uniref:PIG-L deacetylase family protein n=1 Tax=Streptomyces sp. NBC_00133 TaxID=2903624 RepID=UPI00324D3BAD